MRNIVGRHAPLAALRIDRILHTGPSAPGVLGQVVLELGPRPERAELQTIGESFIELGLQRVEDATADWNVTPLDCLILREWAQRLRYIPTEAGIRWTDTGGLRRRGIDV